MMMMSIIIIRSTPQTNRKRLSRGGVNYELKPAGWSTPRNGLERASKRRNAPFHDIQSNRMDNDDQQKEDWLELARQ